MCSCLVPFTWSVDTYHTLLKSRMDTEVGMRGMLSLGVMGDILSRLRGDGESGIDTCVELDIRVA